MGCCTSSAAGQKPPPLGAQKHRQSMAGTQELLLRSADVSRHDSRAPPPVVEEETVKEVLSETPRPKLFPPSPPSSPPKPPVLPFTKPQEHPELLDQDDNTDKDSVFEKKSDNLEKIEPQISELSEICSLSETMSATTTITRDDDEEVHQRVNRSPMKLRPNRDGLMGGPRRDRVVGKSPTRRTESSPGRRYGTNGNTGAGSVRLVQSREPGPGQMPMLRPGSRAESNRRDPGESSGRRSRSPATRVTDGGGSNRANVGRSPSARRSGRYPGRNPVGPVESSGSNWRAADQPNREGTWGTTNESIDNPLVSLECFIFL